MADLTAQELIEAALRINGKLPAGQSADGNDASDGLEALRILLRGWSAKGMAIYAVTEDTHVLTPGTLSYTIGATGTIATARPVRIDNAFIRPDNNIDIPLKIIGADKYQSISMKDIGIDWTSWLYYNPTYPDGTIFLYPPGGGTLYLYSLKVLSDPTLLTTSLAFPGEYDAAIKWNLACEIAPEYGLEPTLYMLTRARESLDDVINLNAALSIDTVKPEMLKLSRSWHIDEG